jgi:hypothetical protein
VRARVCWREPFQLKSIKLVANIQVTADKTQANSLRDRLERRNCACNTCPNLATRLASRASMPCSNAPQASRGMRFESDVHTERPRQKAPPVGPLGKGLVTARKPQAPPKVASATVLPRAQPHQPWRSPAKRGQTRRFFVADSQPCGDRDGVIGTSPCALRPETDAEPRRRERAYKRPDIVPGRRMSLRSGRHKVRQGEASLCFPCEPLSRGLRAWFRGRSGLIPRPRRCRSLLRRLPRNLIGASVRG